MLFFHHQRHISTHSAYDVLPDLLKTLYFALKLSYPPVFVANPGLCIHKTSFNINDLLLEFNVPLIKTLDLKML